MSETIQWVPREAEKRFPIDPRRDVRGALLVGKGQTMLRVWVRGEIMLEVRLFGPKVGIEDRMRDADQFRKEIVGICAQFGVFDFADRVGSPDPADRALAEHRGSAG